MFQVTSSDINDTIETSIVVTASFADFSDRMIAAIIDNVICYIASMIINSWLFNEIPKESILFGILNSLYHTIYFAGLESSSGQATLGKRIMKIKVIRKDGQRISFRRGIGRYWGKTISVLVLFMGVISIYRDKQRQGWHDMLANTFVIKESN